jgi:tRNA (guanine-N7-)-methyltransferase
MESLSIPAVSEIRSVQDEIEFHLRDLTASIDWAALFGNAGPLEIEIGSGKGRFLIQSALAHPDIHYVGIERSLHYFRIARERVLRQGLTNVRLLRDDAGYFVQKFIPDASVTAYHVYFPDPWPKKRHWKRRLFTPDFVDRVERTLTPGGTIDLATDHDAYFEEIVRLLDGAPGLRRMAELPERVRRLGPGITNFEAKYLAEGRPIYRAAYRRDG